MCRVLSARGKTAGLGALEKKGRKTSPTGNRYYDGDRFHTGLKIDII